MGGGGVSPFEWVIPAVAITHQAVNTASQQISGNRAKIITPGSQTDKQNEIDTKNEQALGEQRLAADNAKAAYTYNTTPQSPQEELAARRRAQTARQSLGLGSASQQLTGTLG